MPLSPSCLHEVDYFYFINKKSQVLVDIHGNTIIPLTANQAILPPSDNMLRLAKVEKKQIAKVIMIWMLK